MVLTAQMMCVLICCSIAVCKFVYTLACLLLMRNNSYYGVLPICSISYGKCYKTEDGNHHRLASEYTDSYNNMCWVKWLNTVSTIVGSACNMLLIAVWPRCYQTQQAEGINPYTILPVYRAIPHIAVESIGQQTMRRKCERQFI
jgi:hypothetical protein